MQGAVKTVTLWAPAIALGAWGVAYVRDCLGVLEAPGLPVQLQYTSPGGIVRLTASSYAIDLGHGTIRLAHPKVQDPSGGVLAQAGLVSVFNLDIRRGIAQNIRVTVDDVQARLVRLKNGRLELENLLPKREGAPLQIPYDVVVRGARLRLIDLAGPTPWEQTATTSGVHVSGVGDDWVAEGTTTLPTVGSVQATVQHQADFGLRIDATTRGLQLEGAFRHVAELFPQQLANVRAESIVVSGPLQIIVPRGRSARLAAVVNVSGFGLRYGAYGPFAATFNGRVSNQGAQGVAEASTAGIRGSFVGSATLKPTLVAAGQAVASVTSPARLPAAVRKLLPPSLQFRNARYAGWMSYQDKKPLHVRGRIEAESIGYQQDEVRGVTADLSATPEQVAVYLRRGAFLGVGPGAVAIIDPVRKTIRGAIDSHGISLGRVARRFGLAGIDGKANLAATIDGTVTQPRVAFVTTGDVRLSGRTPRPVRIDRFEAAGTYGGGIVRLDRGLARGPLGLVTVSGQADQSRSIDLQVDARNFNLSLVSPEITGIVNASGRVTGPVRNPRLAGHVEGYNVTYLQETIPAATADIVANRAEAELRNVVAVRETAELIGLAKYKIASKKLSGTFSLTGIQATDVLGEEVAGRLDSPQIDLSGTLNNPSLTAIFEGKNLVARGVKIDAVAARARVTRREARLLSSEAVLANGRVAATGVYRFADKAGDASLTATNLTLSMLAPDLSEQLTLGGTTAVREAKASYRNGTLTAEARGRLDDIVVNSQRVGDGNWTASTDGRHIQGGASIGRLDPDLRAIDVEFDIDQKTRRLTGKLDADRMRIESLYAGVRRYLPGLREDQRRQLDTVAGDLTLGVDVSGDLSNPDLAVRTLSAQKLQFAGRTYGDLVGTGIARADRTWTVEDLRMTGPYGLLTLTGRLAEQGDIAVTATAQDLLVSGFAPIAPDLATNGGVVNLTATATGATMKPDIDGHFWIRSLLAPLALDGAPTIPGDGLTIGDVDNPVRFSLTERNGGKIAGRYSFTGFTGNFDAAAPFSYARGFADGSVAAKVTLDDRALSDLRPLQPYLDPARTTGHVGGTLTATGPANAIVYAGGLTIQADRLGIKLPPGGLIAKVDDTLQNVTAGLSVTPEGRLALVASAASARGGNLAANVSAPNLDLRKLVASGGAGDDVLGTVLLGSVTTNALKFRQGLTGGYVAGELTGSVPIGGTVRRPTVGSPDSRGAFIIKDLDTVVPTLAASSAGGAAVAIDPSFDLTFALLNAAHVRSATADLYLTGDGSLNGRLSSPVALANLVVDRGNIALPGSVVRISPGGTLDFSFRDRVGDAAPAVLDADLQGKTSITATRYGESTQRYDITLEMRGDLLKDQGLRLQAFSDPPDLDTSQVLALLGQRDLLESLGSQTSSQSATTNRLRNALVGFALPTLTNSVTNEIAKGFGLDYFNVEYNQVDQTTFSYAKALGSGFSIQGRQQIGTPTPGYRAIYDLRMVYTPPAARGTLRRFSFSFGADQDRPLKLALEYGLRFGGTGNSGPSKSASVISSPGHP